MLSQLQSSYGMVLNGDLLHEIAAHSHFLEVKKGHMVMDVGDSILGLPMLMDGAIKILRVDDEGDEMLLYFLETGDSCAMTIGSHFDNAKSEIRAVAEKDSTLVILPLDQVHQWMRDHSDFQRFILESFNTRLKEMAEALDALAFQDLQGRLSKYLDDRVKINGTTSIHTTHAEIAADLNTSRVVVSRMLKQCEREGKIELHRNRIEVLNF